jgi:hypothetical protein
VAASLELAALPRTLEPSQCAAIAEAAVEALTAPRQQQHQQHQQQQPHSPAAAAPASPPAGGSPTAVPAAAADADDPTAAQGSFHFDVGSAKAAGLPACFALSAGFVPPAAAAESRGSVRLGIALRSSIPADLPVTSITVSAHQMHDGVQRSAMP